MNTPEIKNDMELELYCGLLILAYKVQEAQTEGFVCGKEAEEIRDEMYQAIKEANIL